RNFAVRSAQRDEFRNFALKACEVVDGSLGSLGGQLFRNFSCGPESEGHGLIYRERAPGCPRSREGLICLAKAGAIDRLGVATLFRRRHRRAGLFSHSLRCTQQAGGSTWSTLRGRGGETLQ